MTIIQTRVINAALSVHTFSHYCPLKPDCDNKEAARRLSARFNMQVESHPIYL